jgi:hypothetical protein
MAIDITKEQVLPLQLAAKMWLPAWDKSRAVHHGRLRRAIARGELEGLKFGSQWLTSREAIMRWGQRMAAAAFGPPPPSPGNLITTEPRTPTQRSKDIERAERELAARQTKRGPGRPKKTRPEPAGA